MQVVSLAFLALAVLLVQPVARAESPGEIGLTVSIASDYVFRGISQTMGEPAFQGSVDVDYSNGVYASLWASNVDFVPDQEPDDGARLELDLVLGVELDIGSQATLDLSVVRYLFPGTIDGVDYDYTEWLATTVIGERFHISSGYADSVFGTGQPGWFYETGAQFPLRGDIALGVRLGRYDLDSAYGARYNYYQIGVSRRYGALGWELTYHDTSASAEEFSYASVSRPRAVFSVFVELGR